MNLAQAISLYANSETISRAVRRVFVKKTGKARGSDIIGEDIKQTAIREATKVSGSLGPDQLQEIKDFVDQRLEYISNTFKKLNDPMKDRSDERAEFVGETEERAAREFGRAKGHEWSGEGAQKQWVTLDPCLVCAENEEAGPIAVGEDFPSGHYSPPAHPNCVCTLEYVQDEDEDYDEDVEYDEDEE